MIRCAFMKNSLLAVVIYACMNTAHEFYKTRVDTKPLFIGCIQFHK